MPCSIPVLTVLNPRSWVSRLMSTKEAMAKLNNYESVAAMEQHFAQMKKDMQLKDLALSTAFPSIAPCRAYTYHSATTPSRKPLLPHALVPKQSTLLPLQTLGATTPNSCCPAHHPFQSSRGFRL
eukprot:6339710-Alexandrium_andersonii.AAC.1